ncbi:MAG: hypothetical protein CYPHOPRED_000704 [Cyphobasidiales sp. Tagirdzhanova-0007]|nr:MAG: hypothetical protein CYPHOPRED_000704 [Cyphobasidiales sp. Tagirdzhanova-0007]
MGLLALGTPLAWQDAEKFADHVREHGITQFLHIWDKLKGRVGDGLLWGDEIEYMVVSFDEEARNARLSLRQSEILKELAVEEAEAIATIPGAATQIPKFHPEYGRYMLESTPGAPYGATLKDVLQVETNMRLRRKIARGKMHPNEVPVTLTSFPRLGVKGVFLDPHHEPDGEASQSLFLPDQIINPHVRFPTLAANIRRRRGSKVAINMPIFFDKNTPKPFIDPSIPWDRNIFPGDAEARTGAALPDHIYMDAMGFGMGCSCLQITFQASNVDEARRVYDSLVPVGPIMLALTAAAPVFRGYLSDVDCRWNVIAGSVDDRTDEERGLKPLKTKRYLLPKSRYDSVDCYLSRDPANRPEYNDNNMPLDEDIKNRLLDHGIDELLANHIAHLFIRDPLVIFSETVDQDDEVSADHFENLQSTNWQTMRFKPPPPGSNIGWRVEFRSMEVQLTDFENAAYSIFIVLLTRAILSFGLDFYIPISKVDENMKRAHVRNAAREGKFFFKKNVFQKKRNPFYEAPVYRCASPGGLPRIEDEYEEMTINEIINGKSGNQADASFPGLLGLVYSYLNSLNVDISTRCALQKYFDLIKQRANGTLKTTATWIREFVQNHPEYRHDSVVSQGINFDLIHAIDEIERGVRSEESLLGKDYVGSDNVEVDLSVCGLMNVVIK